MQNFNFKNVKYQNDLDGKVCGLKATIDNVECFVPLDLANRHYIEIKRQVDAGELTIEDAD
mgnify:FL=1